MSTTSSFIDNELDQQAEILKGMQDNLSQICAEKEIISKENEQLQMQLDDLKKSYSSLEADKDELIEQLTSEKVGQKFLFLFFFLIFIFIFHRLSILKKCLF